MDNRRWDKKYDTLLEDAFKEAINRISEHNLSIEEIALNIDADPKLVHVLLTNPKVVEAVSNILFFTAIRVKHRPLGFFPYTVFDSGKNIVKIRRNIKPVFRIYYSRATQEFYNFKEKIDGSMSEEHKAIYLTEMMEALETYINNNK